MKVIALCRSEPEATGSVRIKKYRVLHDDGKIRNDLMAMMVVARFVHGSVFFTLDVSKLDIDKLE